jgi:hypothetical protein
MTLQHRLIEYRDGDTLLEGRLAWDGASDRPRPGVLVAHAFTNPAANDPVLGTVYDEAADRRSWQAMTNFLDELFNG